MIGRYLCTYKTASSLTVMVFREGVSKQGEECKTAKTVCTDGKKQFTDTATNTSPLWASDIRSLLRDDMCNELQIKLVLITKNGFLGKSRV